MLINSRIQRIIITSSPKNSGHRVNPQPATGIYSAAETKRPLSPSSARQRHKRAAVIYTFLPPFDLRLPRLFRLFSLPCQCIYLTLVAIKAQTHFPAFQ
jgi:hypothetical protein